MDKKQKEALTFLIKCIEYAQSKGVFSLLDASTSLNSINILMSLLEEKE
ncbi:hypothetical protein [Tenacibaculum mesophilum]|nr:hypothetical protein [Tenacibaculum mesophilum]GFD75533.1 hypothetical protein KUL113_49530 [Tenacibaculum sp. KUL113]